MKINNHMKDVFEFAKKTELDGKRLYEKELERTKDKGLRSIFKMLIKAEENHYKIFEDMQKNKKSKIVKTSIADVKNIFEKMLESKKPLDVSNDHEEFYKKILKFEETSEAFYRKEAEGCTDNDVKKALVDIADEEHRHVILMNSLVKMVRNPKQWVEDAEFNHLENY